MVGVREVNQSVTRDLVGPTVILALALLAVCRATTAIGSDAGATSGRPVRIVTSLAVNASNTERLVAVGICEDEGVREIGVLLTRSKIEELWAFLPEAPSSEPCQWHEVGRNEHSADDGAYVDVDWTYLESLMAENLAVHLYHFHPLAFFDYAKSRASGEKERPLSTALVTDLKFSMPSPADIHFMMEITSRFHRYHPSAGNIENSVVTPYGIVEYGLTDAGRVKYESDKDARTQGLYIKYVAASALDDGGLEKIIARHSGDMTSAINELVEVLNSRYLKLTFTPAHDL